MNRVGGIFVLIWIAFTFVFHMVDFSNSDISTYLYFGGNDCFIVGFALLMQGVKIDGFGKYKSQRLLKVVLIYAIWRLIVDSLIMVGIGGADTAIFSQIDVAILGAGTIWAIIL